MTRPAAPRGVKTLSVMYRGWGKHWQLGTLADNGRDLLFEYHADALAQGLELSPHHLPLRAAAYGAFPAYLDRLPGLIADALPDGWGRLLRDRQFEQEGRNPVSMSVLDRLAFIGDRAVGALTFEPAEPGELSAGDASLRGLAEDVQQFETGVAADVLKRLALLGGSPQGARPKVLVNYDLATEQISDDPAGAGHPWLVKFPGPKAHPEVCAIEALYAQLAADCGIAVPPTHYFELGGGLTAFGVARFDREDGMRVPTHTLAGLLHTDFRLPILDYTTFLRTTRFLTRDEREVRKAFLRCVFNVVFHNRDDHAKNVSFRLDQDQRWKLAPGYDLTFSTGPGGGHYMAICGEDLNPGRLHLLRLADEVGIARRYALDAMDEVAAVADAFTREASRFPIRTATVEVMAALIAANLARMR